MKSWSPLSPKIYSPFNFGIFISDHRNKKKNCICFGRKIIKSTSCVSHTNNLGGETC
jgi:hypothetical protein